MSSSARRFKRRLDRAARQRPAPQPPRTAHPTSRALAWSVALAGGVLVASSAPAAAQITSCDVNTPTTNGTTYNVGSGQSCATLTIDNTTLTQTANGVLNAINGGVVNLNSGTISGGTLATSGTGRITATNSGNNYLSGVTLAGTLDLASSTGLVRVQNGLTFGNGGTINIDSGSLLAIEGSQTLGGTGTIVFGAAASNNRLNIESPGGGLATLTVGAGVTIRGQNGLIGAQSFEGGPNAIVNNGTIAADVSGGTITIYNAAVTNNNVLGAANGGTLDLQSAVTNGPSGLITAANGGIVYLDGTSITGGTINTTGGATAGLFRASNSGNNFLNGVTVTGALDLATNTSIVRVGGGGLTVTGGSTVNVNSSSIVAIEGNQTLGGSGSLTFGATGGNNRLNIESPGGGVATLTVGSGFLIHGQNGTIGAQNFEGGPNAIVNNGTIAADVAGGTITIVNAAVTNNGTLAAQNGGTLVLSSNVTGNAGSQILAGAGSVVLQNGVTVAGQINTSGGGAFQASNSGNNYLSAVTLNGALDLASNTSIERVQNNLTLQNGSTINVNSSSVLAFEGTQTLGGSGTITLGATGSNNRLNIESPGGGLATLTVGAGVTIHGQNGTIGAQNFEGGPNALVNNGTISADVAGGTITVVNASVTNNGTLAAQNGGTLVLSSNVTGNAGSQILAGAGSVVVQNGVTVSGQINVTGGGAFQASNSGNNYLSAVTLNGALDLATNTSIERLTGGLTLQGGAAVNINSSSVVAVEGSQTIGGTGTITFGATGSNNRLNIESPGGATSTLTVGSGVTIHGQNGTIGAQSFEGGPNAIVNNGTIAADVAGGTITIVNAAVTNNGTLAAQNGGTLVLSSNVTGNAGSQILAGAGSVVLQNGVTVAGQINTSGGGAFQASNSGNNYLSAVTLNGALDLASNTSIERVQNNLTLQNGSTINVNSSSVLAFEGTQTLGGSGTITLGATGSNNRLNIESPGGGLATLTVGAGVTIHGQNGTIGAQNFEGGPNALVNNGTISADVAGGTITVVAPLSGVGTIAANGGTLALSTGQGNVSQGTLAIGGAGSQLANGTANITLSSDYTNASAGSGNAFNRRAGITGSGVVLAGGDVSQAITGANVANGTSNTNATLTIGNVRVGSTDYTYNIAANGTSGPALRGAIQTTVNGANISDSRLSVTATNYGPIAVGSSEAHTVTFTTTAAGALTPLSGQAINLNSAYANIGDANGNQKLNIVLGSGAAAYNAAQGSASPSPVNFGNTRVGGALAQSLAVSNVAPIGAYTEKLDASFGATTGAATNNGGSVNLLAAGSTNSSAMTVGLNTATAGAKTGTVALNYVTDGTGTSGLAAASVGSQTITVNGNVYQVAVGQLNTGNPYNFGTVQVGQSVSRTLSFTNAATGPSGYVEDLNVRFGGSTDARVTGTGAITGLTAGSTNASSMVVGVNTSGAGTVNGSIRVNYFSAGAVGGASNGLGELGIGGVDYGVQGTIKTTANVVNAANPVVNTNPVNLGATRVGGAALGGTISVSNQLVSNQQQQAALNASISGTSPVTASGSFTLLAPGATDNSSLHVGIGSGTAGTYNGTATLTLVSDASNIGGCSPNCQMMLPSQNVSVTGKVYAPAIATLNTSSVNFGIVHVGDNVSRTISVGNGAATTALNDVLTGSVSTSSAGFSASGSLGGVAAGATDNSSLAVRLATASSGQFSGSAAVAFASHDPDLADLSLGSQNVTLVGQVNNYAAGDFAKTAGLGAFSRQDASDFTLDFGNVAPGSSRETASLAVDNIAQGFADLLNGAFSMTGSGFILGGFNPFTNLAAGQGLGGFSITFDPTTIGSFSEVVTLNGYGTNASGYSSSANVAPLRLTIRGSVGATITTPEPSTWALMAAGLAGVGVAARRRRRTAQVA